ncbi:MAG: ankyrin repeat domain-containing protein [Candidatus Schekmanbacteria bacterium]|nr:ankyrin repeat domain-containing protein [Candidatus Schekmanbacteria bacterium]
MIRIRVTLATLVVLLLAAPGDTQPARATDGEGLYEAVAEHDLVTVQRLLENGGDDIDSTLPSDSAASVCAPLKKAVADSWNEGTRLLLAHGADLDKRVAKCSMTMMHEAVYVHDFAVMKFLLEAGADPDLASKNGAEPYLWAAASKKNAKTMALLLNFGADPNAVDNEGNTALHSFATHDFRSEYGDGPGTAAWDTISETVSAFAQPRPSGMRTDFSARNKAGMTPLMIAASNTSVALVQQLVDHGAAPNDRGPEGRTPLHWAVQAYYEHTRPRQYIRDWGLVAGLFMKALNSRMFVSNKEGRQTTYRLLEALIAGGADVSIADDDGRTPSQLASHRRCYRIAHKVRSLAAQARRRK